MSTQSGEGVIKTQHRLKTFDYTARGLHLVSLRVK